MGLLQSLQDPSVTFISYFASSFFSFRCLVLSVGFRLLVSLSLIFHLH